MKSGTIQTEMSGTIRPKYSKTELEIQFGLICMEFVAQ